MEEHRQHVFELGYAREEDVSVRLVIRLLGIVLLITTPFGLAGVAGAYLFFSANNTGPVSTLKWFYLTAGGLDLLKLMAGALTMLRRPRGRILLLIWALGAICLTGYGMYRNWLDRVGLGLTNSTIKYLTIANIGDSIIQLAFPLFVLLLLNRKAFRDVFNSAGPN